MEKNIILLGNYIVLSYKIFEKIIEVDSINVEIISKLLPPINVKGVRNFLSHVDFYKRFIDKCLI